MPYFEIDLAFSHAVQSISLPGMEQLMRAISLMGDTALWTGVFVALACVTLVIRRTWRTAVILLMAILLSQFMKMGVKDLVARPRPTAENVNLLTRTRDYSFPSGHTVHYTVYFGFLCFLAFAEMKSFPLRAALFVVSAFMVLTIGLSRVYLGCHWLTDTLGGYLLGAAILSASIAIYRPRKDRVSPSV